MDDRVSRKLAGGSSAALPSFFLPLGERGQKEKWNSPPCPALPTVPAHENPMNQHVARPGKSERTEHGLTLTEPLPLSGIPAVWRLAALVSTLVMGALAIVGALYLGRSILLPVVAGLIVGITLAP